MELINNELKKKINDEKRPNERVLWSGTPIPIQLAKQALGQSFFGIFFFGFAVFWTYGAFHQSNGESIFPLFGIPFLLVGAVLLFSPIIEWIKGYKTVYVVTDQRAFILENRKRIQVTNFDPERISNIEKSLNIDGSGDVILIKEHSTDSDGDKKTERKGFFAVRNVKEVEKAIRQLCERAT
jgi:hypothetical protein